MWCSKLKGKGEMCGSLSEGQGKPSTNSKDIHGAKA